MLRGHALARFEPCFSFLDRKRPDRILLSLLGSSREPPPLRTSRLLESIKTIPAKVARLLAVARTSASNAALDLIRPGFMIS